MQADLLQKSRAVVQPCSRLKTRLATGASQHSQPRLILPTGAEDECSMEAGHLSISEEVQIKDECRSADHQEPFLDNDPALWCRRCTFVFAQPLDCHSLKELDNAEGLLGMRNRDLEVAIHCEHKALPTADRIDDPKPTRNDVRTDLHHSPRETIGTDFSSNNDHGRTEDLHGNSD